MGYKANTRIKVSSHKEEDGQHYVQVGEDVSEGDFSEKDWADLLQAKAVVDEDQFKLLHPEVNEGANQPMGTPSNLEQIEGTDLQMNPPEDEGDTAPPVRDPLPNPADVVPVEGASTPGQPAEPTEGEDEDE